MQETLDLKKIIDIFMKNLKWIIGSILLGVVVLFLITTFLMTPKYTSKTLLYVNNNNKTTGDSVNINDINASQKLVNTYVVILKDDDFLRQVQDQLSYSITVSELKSVLKMGPVDNTEVLQITAETEDPNLSAEICNTVANMAPDQLIRVVKAGSVEKMGVATPATSPSSPNVKLNCVIGALLGLIISFLTVLIIYLLDNTVKDEEDIKNRFNIPVLGEIPDFNAKEKNGVTEYGK